ncbi:hypothetical protein MHH81_13550 [Psychrobacillus sp. FSL H8-0484]|uniref:hypothetical protein n=1 Tax=Psychrobacillus sp. FSL H8-0484 TaxID=2921390 RepID=UPI0030FB35CC
MLSKKKWMLAFTLVILFVMLDKFEKNDVLSTDYATSLLAPQKPSEVYRKVMEWINPSDDLVSVSAPVTNPPLIEYKSIQPFEKGAILAIDEIQELYASEDGLIIFTGYTKKTGKTLSILYDSGETATFGFVEDFYQLPYTTISAGDIFASVESKVLYIQVEKEGELLETSDLVEWLTASNE